MEKPKIFQIVVLAIFAVLILVGLLGFSGKLDSILPKGTKNIDYGQVTVWGTLPASLMNSVLAEKMRNVQGISIKYVEKNAGTFDRDFLEALASGTGPDLFMLGQDQILRNKNKIAPISYQTFPERTFKDTFLQEGDLFLTAEGLIGIPFTIDPLVMYWNKDIFNNAGIVAPPTTWDEFYSLVPRMTTRDKNGTIIQSFAPLGEYVNVYNAKELITTMMMQAGSPMVANQGGVLMANFAGADSANKNNPVLLAINFYTQFSKSDKDSYTWNRSLPYSRSMFEAGDLALYFGSASEYNAIRQKNPHLNFDVASIPQPKNTQVRMTFGSMEGVAIVKATKNPQGAIRAAILLTGRDFVSGVAQATMLPPVRRDLLAVRPESAILSVFYDSAIIARAWLDPSPSETGDLFRNMIDDVNSGRQKITQALSIAENNLNRILKDYR